MTGSLSDFARSHLHADRFGGGPVIDEESIEALRDLAGTDEPDLLIELINLYAQDAGDRMKLLCDARRGGDRSTVIGLAHSLKSASANMGALALARELRLLEEQGAEMDADALEQAVETCSGMFVEVTAALADLKEMAPSCHGPVAGDGPS